jgi:hypothetical protein
MTNGGLRISKRRSKAIPESHNHRPEAKRGVAGEAKEEPFMPLGLKADWLPGGAVRAEDELEAQVVFPSSFRVAFPRKPSTRLWWHSTMLE